MSFFSMLPPLGTSTTPTFQELFAKYSASIDEPEVVWNRLISSGNPLENFHEHSEASLPHPEPSVSSQLALSGDESASPFAIYQSNLTEARPQPVRWLWQKRLPLAGITLLDGDHGCGKSLLALQIAAHVSSGTPMPDGTPTIQGGCDPHQSLARCDSLCFFGKFFLAVPQVESFSFSNGCTQSFTHYWRTKNAWF